MKKESITTFEWQKITDYLLHSLVAVPIEFPKRFVKSSVVATTTRDCLSFKSRSLDQIAQPRETATARNSTSFESGDICLVRKLLNYSNGIIVTYSNNSFFDKTNTRSFILALDFISSLCSSNLLNTYKGVNNFISGCERINHPVNAAFLNNINEMIPKTKGRTGAIATAIVLVAALLNCPSGYAVDAEVTTTVSNAAPSVDVYLAPDDDPATPGVQVINTELTTKNKTVAIIANVTDMNGYDDLTGVVTAAIMGPSEVEDSPVSLSLDSAVNVTTATYSGSFNISYHSEGVYEVLVTATDKGGLTGAGTEPFTYSYGICELLDFLITDVWTAKAGKKKTRIYYNITNAGTERASPSYTNLKVDGVFVARDRVRALKPGHSSIERFNTYEWICTEPPDDNITVTVCADYEDSIVECIETNNCVTELWSSCTTTNSQFLQVQASSKGDGNSNVAIDALKGLLKFMTGWGKEVEEDAK